MFVTFTENGKPASFPINTAYMLSYLRAGSEDEVMVKRLIARACAAFTKFTNGHNAAIATYEVWYDAGEVATEEPIVLPVRPLQTGVDTAYAYDSSDDETELEALGIRGDGRVIIFSDIPSTTRDHRGIKLEVTVGYSDTTIPDDIVLGIEQYITFLYEQRGSEQVDIPDAVARLWAPYVRHQFGA